MDVYMRKNPLILHNMTQKLALANNNCNIPETDIASAVACMKEGGIILYPTDTVWGLGCDATCAEAVNRIFKLKQRDDSKAMLSLIDNVKTLAEYVGIEQAEKAAILTSELKPRPVTIVMGNAHGIAPQLIASDGTAAFRLTDEPFSASLCHKLGHPVVSTSANVSGENSPAIFREIDSHIINGVDYVVKYRQDDEQRGIPSKIIKLNNDRSITTIRE